MAEDQQVVDVVDDVAPEALAADASDSDGSSGTDSAGGSSGSGGSAGGGAPTMRLATAMPVYLVTSVPPLAATDGRITTDSEPAARQPEPEPPAPPRDPAAEFQRKFSMDASMFGRNATVHAVELSQDGIPSVGVPMYT
ncbi:MAG: hypothetical protein ACRDPW_02365, partial [Mycobacteriales bacterium]